MFHSFAYLPLLSSLGRGSLKQGGDENAYLAFHIKATAREAKHCYKAH